MHNVSSTAPDPWAGNPIIQTAEDALRHFGGQHLSRAHAATLLELWRHRPELTDREVAAVLSRFTS